MQLLPQPCNIQSPCAYTVTYTHCPWIGGTGGPKCPVSGTCPLCNLLQHSVPSGSWDQPGSGSQVYIRRYSMIHSMIHDEYIMIHYDLWYMMIHVIYIYNIQTLYIINVCMYLSIHPSIRPSVRPSIHPWIIHPSIHPIYIFMYSCMYYTYYAFRGHYEDY